MSQECDVDGGGGRCRAAVEQLSGWNDDSKSISKVTLQQSVRVMA